MRTAKVVPTTRLLRRGVRDYDPIRLWLDEQTNVVAITSFAELGSLAVFGLPDSAYKYQAWWANQNPPSPQSRSWQKAGWSAHPNLKDETVTFRRLAAKMTMAVSDSDEASAEPQPILSPDDLSEDEIKTILGADLIKRGWRITTAMGKAHGIDISAIQDLSRWVIEAKGSGSLNPMRVNYFLAILGEILQRMDDPAAKYSIALPDLQQFRNLWFRLPALAKQRTGLSCMFVRKTGEIEEVY